MPAHRIHKLQLLLLAIYVVIAALLWPDLPERIPIHFDLSGEVSDWAEKSLLTWFGLPALAVVLTFFLHLMGDLAGRSPDLWNIPDKKRFLALAPEQRAPIEEYMRRLLAWTSVFTTFTLMTVHAEIYTVGIGGRSLGVAGSMMVILLPTVALLVMAFRMSRNVKRMVEMAGSRHE